MATNRCCGSEQTGIEGTDVVRVVQTFARNEISYSQQQALYQ